MIEKLREQDLHLGYIEPEEVLLKKINELVDAVNGMLYWHENLPRFWQNLSQKENTENEEPAENVQPDYVTTTYPTDGHTKKYYGQNGASIVTDRPLPAGYVITIREPETKGGDNE